MEHKLDTKTVEQIKDLVKFIQLSPDRPPWLDHFDDATSQKSADPVENEPKPP